MSESEQGKPSDDESRDRDAKRQDSKQQPPAQDRSKHVWNRYIGKHGPQHRPPLIERPNRDQFRFSVWFMLATFAVLSIMNALVATQRQETIAYSAFKEKIAAGEIARVEITVNYLYGVAAESGGASPSAVGTEASAARASVYRTVRVDDPQLIPLMDEKNVEYFSADQRGRSVVNYLLGWGVPLLMLLFLWRVVFKRLGETGSQVMSFGKNRSLIVAEGNTGVGFEDVAGADEAKGELMEVVDFLKHPEKYTEIGGKIPNGVLLVGAPGTGKTLLARAVAGEAGVPFFRISGADFVEMFVGVGAARVRDLFKQAREKAPCIVFIDELDALGKARIATVSGNDEREQALNQLLVEMDGFDSTTGVIVLAATNRPEILDPALLRPGRFDRQIVVDKPDVTGREAILKVHAKGVKFDPAVDLRDVARSTPGFVGADLANLINEAAILAVRGGRKQVTNTDLSEATEKMVAGLERKSRVINEKERRIVAYHEAGHAVVAAFTPGSDPVSKISIVPRGLGALGYTLQMPLEDRYLMTKDELIARIDVLLGGRAAEEITFGAVSTGASNDLVRSTDTVRKMITEYGMSSHFPNITLTRRAEAMLGERSVPYTSREYSEATQNKVDQEIKTVVDERYRAVMTLLKSKGALLETVARRLLEDEVIEAAEFHRLVAEA